MEFIFTDSPWIYLLNIVYHNPTPYIFDLGGRIYHHLIDHIPCYSIT